MDTKISIVTEQQQNGVYVAQFKVFDLFIFSYYVESAGQAYIIDPTFDYYVYRDFITKRGATLKYVLLTHYHADFLAGHTQFNVPIIMGQKAKKTINKFEVHQYADGKSFTIGKVSTKVIHTPGHTHQSACFVLSNADGKEFSIFTGDTVFLGQVGRPDLAVSNQFSAQDLAGELFNSIQKIKKLDPTLRIYPGHGAGSSCGKNIGAGNFCNLGTQFATNYGFTIESKQEFIHKLGDGLAAPPQYFFYDAKLNVEGINHYENILKTANTKLSLEQFSMLSQKLPIIDTRHNVGKGILKNSYWLTQKGDISRWISNILKPEDQFIVIATVGQQQQVINRFLRIGYFGVRGYAAFDLNQWKGETTFVEVKTLVQLGDLKRLHLDVRNPPEWQQFGVFPDSVLIPLPQFEKRAKQVLQRKQVSQGITVVVNCRTGMRARLAASVLLRNGIKVIPIVLNQKFDDLKGKGVVLSEWKQ